MTIDADFIRAVWDDYLRRVEAIRAVGGISEMDVAFGNVEIPDGWVKDVVCAYWVPPYFSMTKH